MSASSVSNTVRNKLALYGSFIRFSHTIFALPFVLGICVICFSRYEVSWAQLFWILVVVVAARTLAMSFNRLVDRDIDAANPRTQGREIPAEKIGVREGWIFFSISTAIYFYGTWQLGWQCFMLAPLVFIVLCGYSLTKRYTSYSHFVLGLALALAPGGAWFALTQEWSLKPVVLMLGVLFWVAGFDIIYSCQDDEFDKRWGLHSLPASFGREKALRVAKFLHWIAILLMFTFGAVFHLGWFYYLMMGLFSLFLVRQHTLVSADDLREVDAAFFTQNGLASITFFVAVLGDSLFVTGI